MSKIMIEIPDYQYRHICEKDSISLRSRGYTDIAICAMNAVKNGIVLPDNTTNGDVIKALFPKVKIHQSGGYTMALFQPSTFLEDTRNEWWNAPYEVNDGETL